MYTFYTVSGQPSIREGDVLVVTKLDRLARSMQDLIAIAKRLQKKGAELKVIDQSIDTTTPEGRLMFNVIGSFAEFENDIRKARQMDGIRKARDKGIAFGRKHVLNGEQRRQIVRLSREEGLSLNQLATRYGVSHMTVYRVIKRSLDTALEPEVFSDDVTGQTQADGHVGHPITYSSYG